MGYEVVYHFQEKTEEGWAEETQKKKVPIGKAYEDVELEILAGKIMAQLARQAAFLVTEVEIYEFARKELSYRESDDGIIIKNKKFRFDDGPVLAGEDAEEGALAAAAAKLLENPELLQQLQVKKSVKVPASIMPTSKRPQRWEYYDPDLPQQQKAAQANLKFTQGKRYPILEELSMGGVIAYKTQDDTGTEKTVSSEYFVPKTAGKLAFEDQMNEQGGIAPGLDIWSGVKTADSGMPDLRG